MDHAAVVPEGAHAPGDECAALDLVAGTRDYDPIHVLDPLLPGQLRADLREHFRHELAEPSDPSRHDAGGVLLGHPIGGGDIWVSRIPGRTDRVVLARETLRHRTVLSRVERVADRRLEWLVVRGERPILESAGRKQPGATIGLEREWIRTGMAVDADAIDFGGRVGGFGFGKVRAIESGPLALRAVPPDIFLALRPGQSLRVGRGPVVEHAP